MITHVAVGLSVLLFIAAAMDQWIVNANIKVALLYLGFAFTNSIALWIGTTAE